MSGTYSQNLFFIFATEPLRYSRCPLPCPCYYTFLCLTIYLLNGIRSSPDSFTPPFEALFHHRNPSSHIIVLKPLAPLPSQQNLFVTSWKSFVLLIAWLFREDSFIDQIVAEQLSESFDVLCIWCLEDGKTQPAMIRCTNCFSPLCTQHQEVYYHTFPLIGSG